MHNEASDAKAIEALEEIASRYNSEIDLSNRVLQNFLTFRQALNVASADQRLLVLVLSHDDSLKQELQKVFSNPDVIGKFHLDFLDDAKDADWQQAVPLESQSNDTGLVIIHSGQFGLKGTAVAQLPIHASASEIETALHQANLDFAEKEVRKIYREHIDAGRKAQVFFENEMPYGEDRNGNGILDTYEWITGVCGISMIAVVSAGVFVYRRRSRTSSETESP